MPTVSVKWQKQIIPAMEIGTSQPPFEFKSQLCALSGVPPERQKIMVQGGLLKIGQLYVSKRYLTGSEVADDGHCRRDSAGSIERSCIYGGFPRRRPSSSLKKVQLTGTYDLVAVLTHKGRSADYVFWVKQENGKWIRYDDHNPIPPRVERILQSYLAAVKTLQEKSQVIGTWQKHLHG